MNLVHKVKANVDNLWPHPSLCSKHQLTLRWKE